MVSHTQLYTVYYIPKGGCSCIMGVLKHFFKPHLCKTCLKVKRIRIYHQTTKQRNNKNNIKCPKSAQILGIKTNKTVPLNC